VSSADPQQGCSVTVEAAEEVCHSSHRPRWPSIYLSIYPMCRPQTRDFQFHSEPVSIAHENQSPKNSGEMLQA